MAIQWPLSPNRGELHGVHQLPRGAPCRLDQCKGKFHICPQHHIFYCFFFFSSYLFLLFWFWKQLPNLFLSLRYLLSCFQHSRTNHCPYLRTSKSYFLEASYIFCFFVVKFVLETITKLVLSLRSSLLSCFHHSRTNHCPYIYLSLRPSLVFSFSHFLQRCAVDDDDIAPSRSITSSKNTDEAITHETIQMELPCRAQNHGS